MGELAVAGAVPRLELSSWTERYGVRAGITVPGEGAEPFDLGLAGTAAPVAGVMERWRRFRQAMAPFPGVVIARQVHGTTILTHHVHHGMLIAGDADGHLTTSPGLLLCVSVADCVPVYLIDPVRRAVALVHAGWRGAAGGILPRAIAALVAGGSPPERLVMHCGPGICGPCYEVGGEVFLACGLAVPPGGRGPLDLRGLLAAQGRESGVVSISASQFCSAHGPGRFFSHRASRGADGRMVAYLGLLP